MESQFENDEQRNDFNTWLSELHIIGKGRTNDGKKFITVKLKYIDKKNNHENECDYNLTLGTKKFNDWLNERIKEYKEINLLK